MRAFSIVVGLLSASSLKVCGSEGSAPQASASASAVASVAAPAASADASISAQAQSKGEAPRPSFGGSLMLIGDYRAELLLRADGEVLAFVSTASGAPVDAAAKLELSANVSVAGGAPERVALRFDAARKCFAGRVKAGLELVPGPVELTINGRGHVAVGRLPHVAVRASASHGGSVLVAGDYSVELVAQGGELAAFVFDANGKASAAADLGLKVELGGASGSTLALTWDAASASYRAKLVAGLDVQAKPIAVTLSAGARTFFGAAASLAALLSARLEPPRVDAALNVAADANAAAKLGAKAGADAKLKAPELKAGLAANASKSASAAAGINVTPPKVNVQKSASASTKGGSAKASAGFSFGVK